MNDNDPVQHLGDAVAGLEDLLLQNALSPDPERRNWAAFRRDLDALESAAQAISSRLGPAWMLADPHLRSSISSKCAETLRDAAIVLQLAGRDSRASALLQRAADLARDGNAKDVLRSVEQVSQRPELAAGECHHRWLRATGRLADPEPRKRHSLPPRFSLYPNEPADLETPVSGAPSLIRINGCGVGLYGCEDQKPDGSYLSAYCVSLLWLPVFPIRWYRVIDADQGYVFVARRRLGMKGRIWQLAAVASVLAVVMAFAKLGNPFTGQASVRAELARLSAIESEGTVGNDELLDRYLGIAQEHSGDPEGRVAAGKAAGLLAARIPSPCKAESVEDVRQQALRFTPIPTEARSGKPEGVLRDALLRCANQLPSDSLEEVEVLGFAIAASSDETQNQALSERVRSSSNALAARIRDQEPLLAMALHRFALPDPKAMDGMLQTFDSLPQASSLVVAAEPAMQAWLSLSAGNPRWQDRAQAVRERVAAASEQHASWLRQIEEASDADLERLFKQNPEVEELAAAYARSRRNAGAPTQGIEALARFKPQGRLTYESRMELASCFRDARNLDEARGTLRSVIRELSLPYREAVERWKKAKLSGWDRLATQARKDRNLANDADLPADAVQAIEIGLSDDPQLKAIAAEVDGPSVVVRAAVNLASIDLAEAMASEGEARNRLLKDAETTLLQMKVAEGDFDYDLQAGVVLHRVGKQKDAEAAFERALQGADPGQTLNVARAYRSIGLQNKARQLAESAYRMADEQSSKWEAAALRSVLWESLEDRKKWLDLCDPKTSRLERLEVEAELALKRGDDNEASRLLTQVCADYEPRIGNSAAQANNAGTAFLRLHDVTGDQAALQKAVKVLSRAAAMAPDKPIVLKNYAYALELLGSSEVAGGWIHVRALRLGSGLTRVALDILADSKLSDSVVDAMLANRSLRLARQVREQYGVLAPHDRRALLSRLAWAETTRDKRELDAVLSQLQRLSPEDSPASGADAGTAGSEDSDAGVSAIELAERVVVDRARKDAHAPSVAIASLLLAERLRTLNRERPDASRAAEMSRLVRDAIDAWPELRTTNAAFHALLEAAFVNSMLRAPAIGRALKQETSTTVWLHDALAGDGAQQVRETLQADKDFLAGAETVKAFKTAGGVLGWELARVLDDVEWKRRAAAGAQEVDYRATEAGARLEPDGSDAHFVEILKQVRGDAPARAAASSSASAAPSSSAASPPVPRNSRQ